MAQKVFQKQPLRNPDYKRNAIDLSRSNHLTTKIGQLTPVFMQEVVPGDSFHINTNFGFRFMPMAFPIQSNIRADIHYFYVRTRAVWKNFQEFRFDTTKGIKHPYIAGQENKFFSNGTLADYLGLPTTHIAEENQFVSLNLYDIDDNSLTPPMHQYNPYGIPSLSYNKPTPANPVYTLPSEYSCYPVKHSVKIGTYLSANKGYENIFIPFLNPIEKFAEYNGKFVIKANVDSNLNVPIPELSFVLFSLRDKPNLKREIFFEAGITVTKRDIDNYSKEYIIDSIFGDFGIIRDHEEINTFLASRNLYLGCMYDFDRLLSAVGEKKIPPLTFINVEIYSATEQVQQLNSPFATENPRIPISAIPFRVYESCYNSFYRNTIISPFKKKRIINGTEVEIETYDEFVTTDGDGADRTPYRLYQRNWEKDVFTSAWKNPQFGTTQPLIGASSSLPEFSVQQMEIDDAGERKTIDILVNEQNAIVGISRYSDNFQFSTIEALQDAIEYGISINDIRNTNALQHWLENNVANGYKYKDEMLSHFGVNINFEPLLMPEYIGGVSENLNVNTIYQQVETETNPLGSFAGVGNIFGQAQHSINKYCDEDGFIIGILSIVPTPAYSSLLPRYFQRDNYLDYYNQEFSQIGMQPILNKDISPLTTTLETQDKVFGYQKPNFEHLGAVDEIHGDFRKELRNFVVNREYSNTPELVQDFIEIKPTEVNDIFSCQENTDKIVGRIDFSVTAERPIPVMLNPQIK